MYTALFLIIKLSLPLILIFLISMISKGQTINQVFTTISNIPTFGWRDPLWIKSSDSTSMVAPYMKTALMTSAFMITTLGYTPANATDLNNYYTKTQGDAKYLQSFTESDPIYTAGITNYFTKTQSDARYQTTITTGTSSQYLRGNLTLGTFPTDLSSFTNDVPFLSSITGGNVTTALGYTPVSTSRTLNINGVTQDLSSNRTWTVGTLVGSDTTSFRTTSNLLYQSKLSISNIANKYFNGYGNFTSINTDSISEGSTNKFYLDSRARAALSLAVIGSGAASYNSTTGILNIPTPSVIAKGKADNITSGIVSLDSAYHTDDNNGNIKFAVKYGTGTVSANAVTINQPRGRISLVAPGLAASTNLSITLTDSYITSTSNVQLTINGNGSSLTLPLFIYMKSQTAGSCVINLLNISLLSIFNSAVTIDFVVFN